MDAEHFFNLLGTAQVTMLVDTRIGRGYQGARFAHGRDLPYLCQAHGIGYVHFTDLAPTRELRKQFHDVFKRRGAETEERSRAWTKFLKEYLGLLISRKVLASDAPIRHMLYGEHKRIAFMCSCPHHQDCHRRVLVGMLAHFIEGLSIEHLNPQTVNGKAPSLKSPRRYLLEDLPLAGVKANPPRGWRPDAG
jgi:uncharacterized protein YeaO (DUF488 family)